MLQGDVCQDLSDLPYAWVRGLILVDPHLVLESHLERLQSLDDVPCCSLQLLLLQVTSQVGLNDLLLFKSSPLHQRPLSYRLLSISPALAVLRILPQLEYSLRWSCRLLLDSCLWLPQILELLGSFPIIIRVHIILIKP